MDRTCRACGARLFGEAAWCGQCLAPVDVSPPAATRVAPAAAADDSGMLDLLAGLQGTRGTVTTVAASPCVASVRPAVTAPDTPEQGHSSGARWWDEARPGTPLGSATGAPATTAPAVPAPGPMAASAVTATATLAPARQANGGLVAMTLGIIGLNVVIQAFVFALGRTGRLEPSAGIRIGLWATWIFYAVVLAVAVGRARKVAFRPLWAVDEAQRAGIVGGATGLAIALTLIVLGRAATGHVVVDPRIAYLVSERSLTRILAAVALAVLVAPCVEELLFRGLVVEGLRPAGTKPAIAVGAVLFALWHLNPGLLVYYFGMGALLGRLYCRRGLVASLAAHAAFNGCIVLAALAAVTGPSLTLTGASGVAVRVPPGWHMPTSPEGDAAGAALAVDGPSGAGLLVLRRDLPPGTSVDLNRVVDRFGSSPTIVPGVSVRPGSAHRVALPAGDAVEVTVDAYGHEGEVVVMPRPAATWTVILATGGSSRARRDFPGILKHLHLP